MDEFKKNYLVSKWMLSACGVWLIGLGFYFITLRPPLLPEDLRFMRASLTEIQMAIPGLVSWLKKVFIVMGGFIVSTGVLTLYFANVNLPRRLKGTVCAIVISGAVSVLLMSTINFSLNSDFKWTLLVPTIVWSMSIVLYVLGK